MDHSRLGLDLHRADGIIGLVRHVVDQDTGQVGTVAVVVGVEDQGGAAAPRLVGVGRGVPEAARALVPGLDGAHGGLLCGVVVVLGVVQPRQGLGQVLGVDVLVGRALDSLLPVVGRRGRRADEEELAGVGEGQVRVGRDVEGRGLAEVDAAPLAHDGLAVPDGADGYGIGLGVEGHEDAAEGLERCPGVDGRRLEDQVLDGLEVVGPEDGGVLEVGEEEGVGCWGRLLQWW